MHATVGKPPSSLVHDKNNTERFWFWFWFCVVADFLTFESGVARERAGHWETALH